ncbi:MAG: hypothetical protein K2I22_09440 [Lachnospiraceae bacterium]|nr:hypothetical protein [Lachnospiraceae bacterium]
MGISVNVGNTSQNYSYLFQSASGGSLGNLNFLSDYTSIKNGSYGKLMKAYYGSSQSSSVSATSTSSAESTSKSRTSNMLDRILEEKRNPKVSKDTQEANAKLTSGLSNLNTSLSTLRKDGTYTDTANGKSAADKVVSAVKAYVSDYNDVVSAAKGSTLTSKTAYVANMMSSTAANADKLAEIGITVNSNGTIDLDEGALKKAGVDKVQELFSAKNVTSYGSAVASRVQFAGATSGTGSASSSTETSSAAASSAASLKADGKALASDSLYEKVKETGKYDIDKIFATAKSFVSNYNSMFDTAESSSNSGVLANLSYIREKTASNADALKQFGINVNAKGRMTIDEDTFKNSDMSKVQRFFQNYGSSVASNASLVDYYMTTQANAANGYTSDGGYNVQGNARYASAV